MKRGQLTLFMIIGIVLVVLVALAVVFREQIAQTTKTGITGTLAMSKEAREVQQDMTACVKELAETGLILIGVQGGYAEMSDNIMHTNTRTKIGYIPYQGTAYMYYKGKNLTPSKETMEKELKKFIEANSQDCKKTYEGMEVTYGQMVVNVKINQDNIDVNVDQQVKVKKEQKESGFNSINTRLQVRLGRIGNVIKQIAEQQIKTSKEEICMSCIARTVAENDMEMYVDRIGEDLFYMLTDKNSKIGEADYIFIAANRF